MLREGGARPVTYDVDGEMRRGSPFSREIPQPEGVVGET